MEAVEKRLYDGVCLSSQILFTPLNPMIATLFNQKGEVIKKTVFIEEVNCDCICGIISSEKTHSSMFLNLSGSL